MEGRVKKWGGYLLSRGLQIEEIGGEGEQRRQRQRQREPEGGKEREVLIAMESRGTTNQIAKPHKTTIKPVSVFGFERGLV